ncbi:MAG: 1-deoxy-D-xylulose-5-phosphate reductoisomerase, partial [Alphaproteobacteria bacterium]
KECLVCAGDLFMAEVEKSGAVLLPCDSEHNAIYQVLETRQPDMINKIILTASGGPFRTASLEEMRAATPAQAVAHPNWDMGAKISVDSASMMNKGLELIEAYHLFPVPEPQLEILVHRQSVIHSMVAYHDGSVLAQLGTPDMRTPISYCLGWPDRLAAPSETLNLAEIGQLDFEEPDLERFPALKLARDALIQGGSAPTCLNATNEIAVAAFLGQKIGFLDIAAIVAQVLENGSALVSDMTDIDAVIEADNAARRAAEALIAQTGAR